MSPSPAAEVARLLASASPLLPLDRRALPAALSSSHAIDERRALDLFAHSPHGQAALAGFFLRLGRWQESHRIAQDLTTGEGSYWHAILHRLEPDSFNAGYWFRRVGKHPVFAELRARAAILLAKRNPKNWKLKEAWDPAAFIEWCDAVRGKNDEAAQLAAEIGTVEWNLLFEWCSGFPVGDAPALPSPKAC